MSSNGPPGGAQVYWVCPLVAESEVLDMAAAEERHAALEALRRQGRPGAWPAQARRRTASWRRLPQATLHPGVDHGDRGRRRCAECLHHGDRARRALRACAASSARGRVGAARRSHRALLYRKPLSEAAQTRLNVMKSTEDGFVIAEEDLKLRGGGEVLGTRQSGLPEFAWRGRRTKRCCRRPATRRG